MKIKAFILFFPFAMFVAETISFPLQANNASKEMTCMKDINHMNYPIEKNDCSKPDGKCDDSPNCSICPVCALFTFLPQYIFTVPAVAIKKNYPLLKTGYNSSYISSVWKPPDSYFFYS
jgi:hypothetical protein